MRSVKEKRYKRHQKIRRKIAGSSQKPRLAVFRSNKHIYAQLIDDSSGKTIASASDLKLKVSAVQDEKIKEKTAYQVGQALAKATAGKVKNVVFDRSGFKYHGRVKALAEGAREGGLKF